MGERHIQQVGVAPTACMIRFVTRTSRHATSFTHIDSSSSSSSVECFYLSVLVQTVRPRTRDRSTRTLESVFWFSARGKELSPHLQQDCMHACIHGWIDEWMHQSVGHHAGLIGSIHNGMKHKSAAATARATTRQHSSRRDRRASWIGRRDGEKTSPASQSVSLSAHSSHGCQQRRHQASVS